MQQEKKISQETQRMDKVRTFETGAARSSDNGKIDPEGFLPPIVILRYSQYMQKHRTQPDGNVRESDNWQRGIPLNQFMKSLWRHFLTLWLLHRGYKAEETLDDSLAAIMFNTIGYWYETIKERDKNVPIVSDN